MFRRVDRYSTDIFLSKHEEKLKRRLLFGFNLLVLETDRLSGSINADFLDLLFVGKPNRSCYLLLPQPKSLYKYIFYPILFIWFYSLLLVQFPGFITTTLLLYFGAKIVAFPILIDIRLKDCVKPSDIILK